MTQAGPVLPEPHFVDRDPKVILAAWVSRYEELSGRTLTPASPESLLIDAGAYRETLARIAIQEAAKQNLIAYARFPMIDILGKLLGADRIPALPSLVPLRFTLPSSGTERTIPEGTRVRSKDRKAIFATQVDVTIPADETTGDVVGMCEAPGLVGNGYIAGQIVELVSPGALPFSVTVANTGTSGGGTASEDTERLRERIPNAQDEYATAGPKEAYRAIAKAAHQDILDVTSDSPDPGVVRVVLLLKEGADAGAVIATVEAALNDDFARPMTDTVEVVEAEEVEYEIEAEVTMFAGTTVADRDASLAASQAAAEAFATDRASRLGRSVVATALHKALGVGSIEEVELLSTGVSVPFDKVARATSITVELA